jgi:hypothetical protein
VSILRPVLLRASRAQLAGLRSVMLDDDAGALARADFRFQALPPGVTFTRASQGTVIDGAGSLVQVAADVPRFDFAAQGEPLGLLIEPSRTNALRNPRAEGAVPGTPGTPPTFWAISGDGGITVNSAALTTEAGMPCVDVRGSGTVATVGNLFIWPETALGIAAATGQAWSLTYYARRVGTVVGVPSNHRAWLAELDAVPAVVVQGFAEQALPAVAALAAHRAEYLRTLSGGASVAYVRPLINLVFGAGTHDFTLRIGIPQTEQGAFSTTAVLPASGSPASSTRAAESVVLAVANGTYDVLLRGRSAAGAAVGEWRASQVVTTGSYALAPPAGARRLRLAQVYPQGTAAANPSWAGVPA